MSRYFAFVFLALSASSVLAAPQGFPDTVAGAAGTVIELVEGAVGSIAGEVSGRAPAELPEVPPVPDTTTLTRPILGERSNGKVYSSSTLRKRDWQYPTSTKDCAMSQVPGDSKDLSYTHDGQEYSQECLSRLALSVPSEKRISCRSAGSEARGYDEECLYKKAFDEDWKFNLEEAKEAELAWRAANPTKNSSDAWRSMYPSSVADCSVDPKSMKKPMKAGEWSGYSAISPGEMVDHDCISRFALDAQIVPDVTICANVERSFTSILNLDATIDAAIDLLLGERSTAEVATSHDLVAAPRALVDVVIGVIEALRSGCLLNIILKLVKSLGIGAKIVGTPLEVVELVVDILAILL